MFNKHLLLKDNDEEVLYLFVDFNFEFSKEFAGKSKKEKERGIYDKIKDYIHQHHIIFNGTKIFLVINGIIMCTVLFTNEPYQDLKSEVEPKYKYVEHIENFAQPNIDTAKIEKTSSVPPKPIVKPSTITKRPEQKPTVTKKPSPSVTTKTPSPTTQPKTNTSKSTTTSPSKSTTQKAPVEATKTSTARMVVVYRSNGTVEEIELEAYLVGVVGAEMPASFQSEALKAQAVAARTYTLKRLAQKQVLTDTVATQAYKDINQLKVSWGGSFDTYYNKVKNAVTATKGEYMAYNHNYIDALYHSTSNGLTENPVDVWGNSFPYLKSTNSPWDKDAPNYVSETTKELDLVSKTLGIPLNEESTIQVMARTEGNNIATLRIDNHDFSGKTLREKLGLRSTDFDLKIIGNKAVFTTRGYGHGVGMSQYGANGMAKEGYSYRQILNHYYINISIDKLPA